MDSWIATLDGYFSGMAGDEYDSFSSILPDPDGGFFVAGSATYDNGADTPKDFVYFDDAVIMKLSPSGKIVWQFLGEGGNKRHWKINSLVRTATGDLVGLGMLTRYEPYLTDVLAIGLHPDGTLGWVKAYGAVGADDFNEGVSAAAAPDGGCAFVAEVDADHGLAAWVVRLDAQGDVLWHKEFYSSLGSIHPGGIFSTLDGGFLLLGVVTQPADDFSGSDTGQGLVLKLSAGGDIEWHREFSEQPFETYWTYLNSAWCGADGTYTIGGSQTRTNLYTAEPQLLLFKLDSSGSITWQKRASSAPGIPAHFLELANGGILGVGGGVILFDSGGNPVWGRSYSDPNVPGLTYGVSDAVLTPSGRLQLVANAGLWARPPVIMLLDSNGRDGCSFAKEARFAVSDASLIEDPVPVLSDVPRFRTSTPDRALRSRSTALTLRCSRGGLVPRPLEQPPRSIERARVVRH